MNYRLTKPINTVVQLQGNLGFKQIVERNPRKRFKKKSLLQLTSNLFKNFFI